ncbi:hypothetical protein Asp14428_52380 [Actinoplanes sp. NBRC 14428]|nr:hypothetical protein Asp14428_52380 [Actinoplanes sp. NBRC 14428]
MSEVYGSARPRRRWGRRLLVTFLVLLIIVAVVLAVADRFAASYAEREISDRVAQQVADQKATAEQPDVTVEGIPFLTQVAAGKYREIKIVVRNFSGPVEKNQTIKMPELDIRAKDVTAPLDTLRTGNGDIVAGSVTGAGTIDYANLADLIPQQGLKLSERDGKLIAEAPIKALNQTWDVSGAATIEVKGGVVRVRFAEVTADGLPNVPVVNALVDSYVQNLALDLKVPALPLGLQVTKVEARPEGLVVTTAARNVPLNSGGL